MIDVRMWSIIDDRRKLLAQVGSMIGDRRSEKTSEKQTLLKNIASRVSCSCWKNFRRISLVCQTKQKNVFWDYFKHATSNCWKSSKCRIYSHTIPAAGMVWGFTECSLTSLPNPILFPQKILNICLCWWKHHMMEKTSWIESQGFSLTNDRFRNQQKYSNTCKW